LYALPGAIHDAFSGQYAAFAQDAIDNQKLVSKGKLTLPVLAIGGDHSYGAHLATEIGFADNRRPTPSPLLAIETATPRCGVTAPQ
jgi:hypothetical protein